MSPDEFDLSDGEDEVIVEAEKDTISTSGTPASSSVSTDDSVLAVVQDALKNESKASDESPEKSIERANELLGYPVKDMEGDMAHEGSFAKGGEVCC